MTAPSSPQVELRAISKRYPNGFLALDDVTIRFFPGEIHALVGENGAGKSTLLNALYGLHQPTDGQILIGGKPVIHARPSDAIANGIGMVHQHFKLIDAFTVAENLRLVARPDKRRALKRAADLRAFIDQYGMALDPDAVVGRLPIALQQRVEILKSLVNDSDLLLLDEPSTILTPREITALYATLDAIKARGTAVAVVTHNIDEVLAHADRYTVLRHGRMNGTGLTGETTSDALIERIVGRAVALGERIGTRRAPGPQRLRLTNITLPPGPGSPGLDKVNLALNEGELVGVAGVEGNGQAELFEVLSSQRKPAFGYIGSDTAEAPRLALVPQDRHHEGLALDLTVADNLLFHEIGKGTYSRFGLLRHDALHARAAEMAKTSDIRASGVTAPARSLSGGNQQKIVIARALEEAAPVIVAYQPTRGLDVAAAEAVLARLRAAASDGAGVLIFSSNIEELIRVSDRIVVMNGGRIAGEVAGDRMTHDVIGPLMTRDIHTQEPAHA